MIYVQFSDNTNAAIASMFSAAQDPVAFPNQGTVEANDPMWKTFYDSMPAGGQQYLPVPTET